MALTILISYLKRLGLEGLIGWATGMLTTGASEDEVMVSLEEQQAFRDRFWMIYSRSNAGHPPMSPNEVLEYEAQMSATAEALGLQVSQREMGTWMAENKSVAEMEERMGIASQVVHMSNAGLRTQLDRLYGITDNDLKRYWLNPKEQMPVLQRRFAAAQVAEQAARQGWWGTLSAQQAEQLVQSGVDADAAAEGFGMLVDKKELLEQVDATEEDVATHQQLQLISGNEKLAKQIKTRGEKRAARFQEGGSFASGKEGLGGLGSAST